MQLGINFNTLQGRKNNNYGFKAYFSAINWQLVVQHEGFYFRLWGCGGPLSPLGSITTQKPYHNKIINQSIESIYLSYKSLYPNQGLWPSGYEKQSRKLESLPTKAKRSKPWALDICPIIKFSNPNSQGVDKLVHTFNYHKSTQTIIIETHVYSDFVVGTELRPTPRLSKAQTSTPLFPSSAAGNWSSSLGVTVPVSPLICGCHESWVPANPDHHPPKISK